MHATISTPIGFHAIVLGSNGSYYAIVYPLEYMNGRSFLVFMEPCNHMVSPWQKSLPIFNICDHDGHLPSVRASCLMYAIIWSLVWQKNVTKLNVCDHRCLLFKMCDRWSSLCDHRLPFLPSRWPLRLHPSMHAIIGPLSWSVRSCILRDAWMVAGFGASWDCAITCFLFGKNRC